MYDSKRRLFQESDKTCFDCDHCLHTLLAPSLDHSGSWESILPNDAIYRMFQKKCSHIPIFTQHSHSLAAFT